MLLTVNVSSSAILNARRVCRTRRQEYAVRETVKAPAEVCQVEAGCESAFSGTADTSSLRCCAADILAANRL